MSLESVLSRVQALETAFTPPPPPTAPASSSSTSFASALQSAMAPSATAATAPLGAIGSGTPGQRMVSIASGEVGQAEQPPGSNDSQRIAQYRTATAGDPGPGPWCAYFVSWVARQAGVPLGDQGQGFGSVDALYAWAQRAGRAYAPGSRQPQPGDLIVFHEHIGLVESVDANGTIHTIEGNSGDQVARRVHAPGDAVGFVSMS